MFISGIFDFLNKKENIFDGNNSFLLLALYGDRVESFLVKRDKRSGDVFLMEKLATEQQEGFFDKNSVDLSRLKLDCSKIKVKLAEKNINTKNVVFALSPHFSRSVIFAKDFKRKDPESKISDQDLELIMEEMRGDFEKEKKTHILDEVQRCFIDGYLVKEPSGLNGVELNVSALGVISDEDVFSVLKELSLFLKYKFKGFFNLDIFDVLRESQMRKINSGVFVNVFENSSVITLLKDGFIEDISHIEIGYLGIENKISEAFSVGIEEAKVLRDRFVGGHLNEETSSKIREFVSAEADMLLSEVKGAIRSFCSEGLLPSGVFISFSGNYHIILEQVFRKGSNWFSDLAFPQNVDIFFLKISDMNAIIDSSNSMYNEEKIAYVNTVVKNIISKIKYK